MLTRDVVGVFVGDDNGGEVIDGERCGETARVNDEGGTAVFDNQAGVFALGDDHEHTVLSAVFQSP
jgi:hypothetical protein